MNIVKTLVDSFEMSTDDARDIVRWLKSGRMPTSPYVESNKDELIEHLLKSITELEEILVSEYGHHFEDGRTIF